VPPCASTPACAADYEAARASASHCEGEKQEQRFGHGSLLDGIVNAARNCKEEQDYVWAVKSRLVFFQQQDQQRQAEFERQQIELRQAEAQKRYQEEEQRRQQIEAQRQERYRAEKEARDQEELRRVEAAWAVLDTKGCADRGNREACDGISEFMLYHPSSSHLDEAKALLQKGREKIAEMERNAAKAQAQKADAEAKVKAQEAAKARCLASCRNSCTKHLEQSAFQACTQACNGQCK